MRNTPTTTKLSGGDFSTRYPEANYNVSTFTNNQSIFVFNTATSDGGNDGFKVQVLCEAEL